MRFLLALLLLGTPALAHAQRVITVQEALLRAKPAVALVVTEVAADVTVTCGPGVTRTVSAPPYRESGTGWFVNAGGWMVTTAQVLSVAHRPPAWLQRQQVERAVRAACLPPLLRQRGLELGARPDIEDDLARPLVAGAGATTTLSPTVSVILSNGGRLPAQIITYSAPIAGEAGVGRNLALLKVATADVPTLPLADSTRANIGDRLHVIGFPDVVMTHELLSSSAKMEASVTSGAISGFHQDVNNQPVIETDAAAAAGAGGSPAVDATGAVVGTLAFPASDQGTAVQGFNFIIPSATIREFLAGAGVAVDAPGRFDTVWRAGLADYFAGRYARAEAELRQANALAPDLPDVRRVMIENAARKQREPLLPWRFVGAVMLVAGAAGWMTVWIQRRRRNEFRIAPLDVARLVEAVEPPLILDVRDDPTYAQSPVRIPASVHVTLDRLANGGGLDLDRSRTIVAYCT